ncbi:MAG TPA: hypothetical protein VKG78_02305 [Opitutaceae bacterium]|nr:hypothetical protein [Opitutaceae bacterium]
MSQYPSLELGLPGRAACPDAFSSASTLLCPGAGKLRVQTSLAAVKLQFGSGIGGIEWEPEQPFYPTVGSVIRSFDAVRVRNLVAGQVAQVLLTPETAE